MTFNEPWVVSYLGYGNGAFAPGKKGPGTYVYEVAHNLLKAHALAYRLYRDEFFMSQKGKFYMHVALSRYIVVNIDREPFGNPNTNPNKISQVES